MFNPLIDNFNKLTDSEIDEKISELSRKYFQTANPQVQQQLAVAIDMFKEEARSRRAIAYQRQMQQSQENGENGLDNLINVS